MARRESPDSVSIRDDSDPYRSRRMSSRLLRKTRASENRDSRCSVPSALRAQRHCPRVSSSIGIEIQAARTLPPKFSDRSGSNTSAACQRQPSSTPPGCGLAHERCRSRRSPESNVSFRQRLRDCFLSELFHHCVARGIRHNSVLGQFLFQIVVIGHLFEVVEKNCAV